MEVPILSYASTATSLSDKSVHPFFFRTCPPDNQQVLTWISMMKHFGWKTCSVIASNDAYGFGNANSFIQLAESFTVDVFSLFSSGDEDLSFELDLISNGTSKIIFLMAVGADGSKVIDQAIKKGIIGKESGYTWILSEGIASEEYLFANNIDNSSERRRYLAGSLGTRPRGGEGELWEEFLQEFGDNNNDNFVPYVVDAVYTIGYAIERILDDGNDLDDGNAVKEALSLTSFSGVTGDVVFIDGERSGIYDILNFRDDNKPLVKVASWKNSTITLVENEPIIWPDGTNNVPSDRINIEKYTEYDSVFGIVALSIISFFLMLMIATYIAIYVYRSTPVMRYSSPLFLGLILLGLTLLYVHLIFWYGYPTKVTCNLKAWIGFIGFSFMLSAQISKTYRVYKIFKQRRKIKKVIITNVDLLKYVAFITLPTIVILVIWTSVDMLKPTSIENNSGTALNLSCSSNSSAWGIISLIYCGFLIIILIFFSFQTRKIPDGFRETYWLNFAAFSMLFCAIVGVTMAYVLNDNILGTHIIITVCVIFGCTSIWGLLFVPKLYASISGKDTTSSGLYTNQRVSTPNKIRSNSVTIPDEDL